MKLVPTVFAYQIDNTPNVDMRATIELRLRMFRERFHRPPIAIWLHPSLLQATWTWPAEWPPVFTNEQFARNIIGMEPGAERPEEPAQLRLL